MILPKRIRRLGNDEDCLKCGLWELCKSPGMEGTGGPGFENPTWMLVGEAPGGTEDEEDEQFIGEAGDHLRKAMVDAGFPEDFKGCRFSNAVRCRPPGNKLSDYPKAPDYCRANILREIHRYNPKVVVLLGATALKSVLGRTGIVKAHGQIIEKHGRYYVCCVHPSYVLRNFTDKWIDAFNVAIRSAYELAKKSPKDESKFTIHVVHDERSLKYWTEFLMERERLTTDDEGSKSSPFHPDAELGCTGFGFSATEAVVFPVYARLGAERQLWGASPEKVIKALRRIRGNPKTRFTLHFGTYDDQFSGVLHNIWMKSYRHDTGLMSYALDPRKGIHDLKGWALRLGMGSYASDINEYKRQHPEADPSKGGSQNLVPAHILYPYNGMDCVSTWVLEDHLLPILKKKKLYKKPYRFPIMYHRETAMEMEINGINIDVDANERLKEEFPEKIAQIEKEIEATPEFKKLMRRQQKRLMQKAIQTVKNYKRQPEDFDSKVIEVYKRERAKFEKPGAKPFVNLGSADLRRELLYDIGGVNPHLPSYEEDSYSGDDDDDSGYLQLTDKGKKVQREGETIDFSKHATVENKYLKRLQREKYPKHFLLGKTIERSQTVSIADKYVYPIQSWLGTDGRSHTDFLVHGIVTGRVSSKNPNHENLPKRSDESRRELVAKIRSQFIATSDDFILLEADEKQIEMRLFADRAQDKILLAEFNAGEDPHAKGAQAGFGYTPETWAKLKKERQKELRGLSKNAISFGLLYGRSARALALDMGWSLSRAEQFIATYFGRYRGCKAYMIGEADRIHEEMYTLSYFGRYREYDVLKDPEASEAQIAEAIRQAINSPIQGDASDITWSAGNRMLKFIKANSLRSKLIIGLHDALYIDVFRKELCLIVEKLHEYMTDRDWYRKMTGWYCSVPLDIDVMVGPNLADMKELDRTKDGGFEIPKELLKAA